MKSLIQKYDKPGPRYTSYPPVPFWTSKPTVEEWVNEVNRVLSFSSELDLYLHIPYCEKLCYYCGCNRIITKDKTKSRQYIDLLAKEWKLYLKSIKQPFKINSLHFGGGTPTFLTPADLDELLSAFGPYFKEDFTGAIEIDPRTCLVEHLEVLKRYGFKRVSLGIQDFDPIVQKKINRLQSFELVKDVVNLIRSNGFESLNFDLIYGLPGQTLESVKRTVELVAGLNPDSIAFYSYAHLPERIPNQRLIKDSEIPKSEQKLELYLQGKNDLARLGYIDIGMDHFAKENSFLASDNITRNFMGYTDKKSEILLGLGATSIGQTSEMFVQNEKDVEKYREQVEKEEFSIIHGHKLNSEEKVTAIRLQDLFCRGEIHFSQKEKESLSQKNEMTSLMHDGLIHWDGESKLKVTSLGKNFLRNIAMAIDPLWSESTMNRFSKTI